MKTKTTKQDADTEFLTNLTQAYQDTTEQELQYAERFVAVSYEADKLAQDT